MNEFMEEGKPVYIGLRYVNQATAIAGAWSNMVCSGFPVIDGD